VDLTLDHAKTAARALRRALAADDVTISHSRALEIVATQLGFADWNTASAYLCGCRSQALLRSMRSFRAGRMPDFDQASTGTLPADPRSKSPIPLATSSGSANPSTECQGKLASPGEGRGFESP
jgi:hypothetical protein